MLGLNFAQLGTDLMSTVLQFVLVSLVSVQYLAFQAITALGGVMSWVLGLRPDAGGAVVYQAWKILRDLCNMSFIVVIILTSFGTIFRTFEFGFLKQFNVYNKKLLWGFMVAAVMINFSLAIGQSIVAISDEATRIMVGILPTDLGDQLALYLQAAAPLFGEVPAADTSNPGVVAPAAPANSLSREQMVAANQNWEKGVLRAYLKCANEVWTFGTLTIADWQKQSCIEAVIAKAPPLPQEGARSSSQNQLLQKVPPPITWAGGAGYHFTGEQSKLVTASEATSLVQPSFAQKALASSPSDIMSRIAATLYSIFLLLVLALSFLAVVIFMVVRIPFIWIILVFSPLAWVGFMLPSTKFWEDWWKQFMAWNIFSPMYLLLVYFGLYLLSQQQTILAGLTKNTGFWDQQFGILLFYIMTAVIFIGGTAAILKFAFAGGTYAGEAFGTISSNLGINPKTGGAVGAVYRGLGLEPRVSGAVQGLQSRYDRLPIIGSEALKRGRVEAESRYKAAFGGGQAREKFQSDQFTKQKDAFQKELDTRVLGLKNSLAQAKDAKEREKIQGQIKQTETAYVDQLRRVMASGRGSQALAAGDILMAKGKLSAQEIRDLGTQNARVSPVAMQGFVERRDKQLVDDASKRKYATEYDSDGKLTRNEMSEYMDLIGDNKKAKEFYDAALKGKNKVLAIETGVGRKLEVDRSGKPLTTDQVMIKQAPKFTPEDLLDVEALYNRRAKQESTPAQPVSKSQVMPIEVLDAYQKKLQKKFDAAQILRSASSDPEQVARIAEDITEAVKEQGMQQVQGEAIKEDKKRLDTLQKEVGTLSRKIQGLQDAVTNATDVPARQKAQQILTREQSNLTTAQQRLQRFRPQP